MNFIWTLTYRALLVPLGFTVFMLAGLFQQKIRQGLILRWPKQGRSPWRNLPEGLRPIWFHCASGEFEYAKPLIRELKHQHPSLPILVTYFSPTYKKNIEKTEGVDYSCALPLDFPAPCKSFLRYLKPRLLLVARTDLWPEMLIQCQQAEIPRYLFSATRSRLPVDFLRRSFLRWSLNQLTEIFTVSSDDSRLINQLGVSIPCTAQGDSRYDQVLFRLDNAKPIKQGLFSSNTPKLIVGSSWFEDEKVCLEALSAFVKESRLMLCFAPHEPTAKHIRSLSNRLQSDGLPFQIYSQSEVWTPGEVLIIDQVGILAELYRHFDLAIVGGSFKSSVHSVMEPLAAGSLCMIGPFHRNNREALEFKQLTLESSDLCAVTEVKNTQELQNRVAEVLQPGFPWMVIRSNLIGEVRKRAGATQRLLGRLQQEF